MHSLSNVFCSAAFAKDVAWHIYYLAAIFESGKGTVTVKATCPALGRDPLAESGHHIACCWSLAGLLVHKGTVVTKLAKSTNVMQTWLALCLSESPGSFLGFSSPLGVLFLGLVGKELTSCDGFPLEVFKLLALNSVSVCVPGP